MRRTSLFMRISLALAAIVLMAMSSMLISFWISEKAANDSLAINIAGSLRMQSYRIGMIASEGDSEKLLQDSLEKIEKTWAHPTFIQYRREKPEIKSLYDKAHNNWIVNIRPKMTDDTQASSLQLKLDQQVAMLDELVSAIQRDAELKIKSFRLVQIVALFLTLLVSSLVIFALKIKVEQPLKTLTKAAKRIAQGDFTQKIIIPNHDELGLMAASFNKMNQAIAFMYANLESQVEEKTHALKTSNTTLSFLYDTVKYIIEHNPEGINYDEIISRLAQITGVDNLELCLMTTGGDSPYAQIRPASEIDDELCGAKNCSKCISSRGVVEMTESATVYRFQLTREQRHYGLVVCRLQQGQQLNPWQEQLIQSTTDQLAIGLSLKTDEDQSRRVAILQERNAIARELHDSLAQALSYLKIQVTRLNSAISKEDKTTMADVAEELREGLNNAYRQLRELLTTFRLKIDGTGLKTALEFSVQQLREQQKLAIELDYQLTNLPLSPNEEIHLLQIVREASQNAIHHSQGKNLRIQLLCDQLHHITLSIEDDGRGIDQTPEKLNHYGLAIMRERGKHLGGDLDIRNRPEGGVGVYFNFVPEFIQQRQKNTIPTTDIT